ncbi:MAG: hypothetical protein MJ233_00225 [Mycoplasmoidaceae bacterium]|nr:hypothetical protein [Mycoplasmoidaceae bacterium]
MKIRKYLCIFGSATALGFCTVLSACNTYPYIPKIKFEASIDSDKTIGFSHHTTDFFPHVDYEINISGTINEGDIIEPVIYQQTCEGKICNNLSIDDDFWKININPDTKKIIVRVEKTPFSENTP